MTKLLLVFLVFASCSAVQSVTGKPVTKGSLAEDSDMAWRDFYGRTDSKPVVLVMEPTCSSDQNGEPGFECPTVGCRQGCAFSAFTIHLIDIVPRSQGVVCHELQHVIHMRAGQFDRKHALPEWQPGGAVDKCNAYLAGKGK